MTVFTSPPLDSSIFPATMGLSRHPDRAIPNETMEMTP